jgi:hypothetical protein
LIGVRRDWVTTSSPPSGPRTMSVKVHGPFSFGVQCAKTTRSRVASVS